MITLEEYLEELRDLVRFEEDGYINYYILFKSLMDVKFRPLRELDENRFTDVIGILRLPYDFDEEVDKYDISLLEVLISISVRVAYDVVGDENPGRYFWDFVDNMGLLELDDAHFSSGKFDYICDNFMDYNGSLRCKFDPFNDRKSRRNSNNTGARNLDIWRQACLYISQKYV